MTADSVEATPLPEHTPVMWFQVADANPAEYSWHLVEPAASPGYTLTKHDLLLKPGDTQVMCFRQMNVGDLDVPTSSNPGRGIPPPPWYDLQAPMYDVPQLQADGSPALTPKGKPKAPIEGYLGKPKGKKQASRCKSTTMN